MIRITEEIYKDLPSLSVNIETQNTEYLKYIGLGIIKIFSDTRIEETCGVLKSFLSVSDKQIINNWENSNKEIYLENYYRIDFDNHIFIFQEYIYEGVIILLGNLLKKDFHTRLGLIKFYQEHLQRVLLNGRETR